MIPEYRFFLTLQKKLDAFALSAISYLALIFEMCPV